MVFNYQKRTPKNKTIFFNFRKQIFSLPYLSIGLMKNKKIVFDWLPPFDIVAKDRELQTEKTKSPDHAGLKKTGNKKRITDWRSYFDIGITYFEQR